MNYPQRRFQVEQLIYLPSNKDSLLANDHPEVGQFVDFAQITVAEPKVNFANFRLLDTRLEKMNVESLSKVKEKKK